MNTETGQIYHGEEEIRRARERGEPLRELSPEEAERIDRERREMKSAVRADAYKPLDGSRRNRDGSKPKFRREKARAKNKAARAARKKNRSR